MDTIGPRRKECIRFAHWSYPSRVLFGHTEPGRRVEHAIRVCLPNNYTFGLATVNADRGGTEHLWKDDPYWVWQRPSTNAARLVAWS